MATETSTIAPTGNDIISVNVVKSSPLPIRLTKLLKDEEWISGSELRTDNSSSDDELSPIRESAYEGHLKVRKIKTRRKKKLVAITSKSKENVNNQKTTSPHLQSESSDTIVANLRGKLDLCNASDEDGDIVWRPKRGSISLIGLESEFNKIK